MESFFLRKVVLTKFLANYNKTLINKLIKSTFTKSIN